MSLFLKALRGEKIERYPVWLMRQAGRYMPQYRELRKRARDFIDFCSNVDLAVEVTLLPERLLSVDALILFSDILVPLIPLGIRVRFEEGRGPLLQAPPLAQWKEFDPKGVDFVYRTIERVKEKSPLPLIGFSGAPFTLLAYILEGKTSREFKEIRKLYYRDRKLFKEYLKRLTQMLKIYLGQQIRAGADAIQIFDSWAFVASPRMFEEYLPFLEELITFLKGNFPSTPVIYFFRGSGHLWEKVKGLPSDALSVDWTLPIEKPIKELKEKAIQGNLDPALLYSDKGTIEKEVLNLLKRVKEYRKTLYVFNLGHGLTPDMELEKVKYLVGVVKNFKI